MMYVILAPQIDAMKIGVSRDPRKRLKDLQTPVPYALKLLYVLLDAWVQEEREFHSALRQYSLSGEWFSVSPESIQLLKVLMTGHQVLSAEEFALVATRLVEAQLIERQAQHERNLAGPQPSSPPARLPGSPPPRQFVSPEISAEEYCEKYQFPYNVTSRVDIGSGPKVLYLAMLNIARMGYEDPTIEELSLETNESEKTVARWHKILQARGLIPIPMPSLLG